MLKFIFSLFLLFNLAGLVTVAADKSRAIHHRWRIPERVFFTMAALGASPGVYGGCLLFRHKTRHKSFMWGLPAILIVQVAMVIWWWTERRI